MRKGLASVVFGLSLSLFGATISGAYWQSRSQVAVGGSALVLPLDGIANLHFAYGLRKLKNGATAAIRILKNDGVTNMDIGWDGSGNFDNTTYTANCTTTCYIDRLYDQSGNGRHAENASGCVTNVAASGLGTNNRWALQIAYGCSFPTISATTVGPSFTVFGAFVTSSPTASPQYLMSDATHAYANYIRYGTGGGTDGYSEIDQIPSAFIGAYSGPFNATVGQIFAGLRLNGTCLESWTAGGWSGCYPPATLGSDTQKIVIAEAFVGKLDGIIFINAANYTDRTNLMAEAKTYYGTP